MDKIIASTIELNIKGLTENFVKTMEAIGQTHGFDVINQRDKLVFVLDQEFDMRVEKIKLLVNDLRSECICNGINYYDLLD